MKKLKLATLDRKAAKLCKLRAGGRCERCPNTHGFRCECSHFVSKGESPYRLRWDRDNLDWLCIHCHRYFHDNPREYKDWRAKAKPEATRRINLNSNQRIPITKTLWMQQENERLNAALREAAA